MATISVDSGKFDQSGKLVLSDIYDNRDPRPYYDVLSRLDYMIPQLAKPVFRNVIEAYREARGTDPVRLVDLGCSYGINAALLRCDMEMDELYELYGPERAAGLDAAGLLERDRELFIDRRCDERLEVLGLDIASRAVSYAERANIIDRGMAGDLEREAPDADWEPSLRGVDLVISTGCIGYVSETTIERVLEPCLERQPWMAHFALRMFPYDPIQESLSQHGYVTGKGEGTYRQRRFASEREQARVIDNLIERGVDPSGLETEGWYHAEFYLSRPARDIGARSAQDLAAA